MSDPKQEESFRVIDRRLFNPDGEIRDEGVREERHKKDAEPAAAPVSSSVSSAKTTKPGEGAVALSEPKPAGPQVVPQQGAQQAVADDAPKPSRGLEMLINFVAQNAAMLLGAYPDPRSGQPILDLEGARELIDMLDALRETTRGNLAPDDDRLLLDVLGSLKLSFMEMTKAAAAMQDKAKARP